MFLDFDPTDDQKYAQWESLEIVYEQQLFIKNYLISLATTDEVKSTKNNLKTSTCQWSWGVCEVDSVQVTEIYAIFNVFLMIQKFALIAQV